MTHSIQFITITLRVPDSPEGLRDYQELTRAIQATCLNGTLENSVKLT